MKIITEEGMKSIVELFLHMPEQTFQNVFLHDSIISKREMSEEEVRQHLSKLRTNIITVMLIGIQKMKDGMSPEFVDRANEIFTEVQKTEPGINAQLMKILKNNNITIN